MFACSRQESARETPAPSRNPQLQESPAPSRDPLIQERIAKNEAFKSGPDSPIPADKRKSFTGLKYYPIDDSLRFTLRLNRYPNPAPVRLTTNTGEIRSGLRYGYFEFTVNGQSCRLQVYRLDGGSGSPTLFIPFRDATSGDETYASGRYIDLAENTTGTYELDFNRAYNPYCAFNSTYSCPLTPAENILTVPIRAGEKKP
jgi:uncharacterized protein (DUF1684 family)